jgi:hypothetical protein
LQANGPFSSAVGAYVDKQRGSPVGKAIAMSNALLLMIALTALPTLSNLPLFELGRNKNANVVVYAARVGPDGLLDDARPFEAHWLLRAEDGRSEPLSFVEELLAYGFSWKARRSGHAYSLTMNAFRERALEVVPHGDAYQVVTSIGGTPSRLVRLFVTADDAAGLPQVRFVDLSGQSLIDGTPTHERIVPPAPRPLVPSARRDEAF